MNRSRIPVQDRFRIGPGAEIAFQDRPRIGIDPEPILKYSSSSMTPSEPRFRIGSGSAFQDRFRFGSGSVQTSCMNHDDSSRTAADTTRRLLFYIVSTFALRSLPGVARLQMADPSLRPPEWADATIGFSVDEGILDADGWRSLQTTARVWHHTIGGTTKLRIVVHQRCALHRTNLMAAQVSRRTRLYWASVWS